MMSDLISADLMESWLRKPSPLDIGPEQVDELLETTVTLVRKHADGVADGPVAPVSFDSDQIRKWVGEYDFSTPHSAESVLADVATGLTQWGVHTTHPRYFGLFNPTPHWWGVAGELLTAAFNPQLAAYSHAPAAVEIEQHVLRFLADRLGLPSPVAGSFTTGGAEANLSAVLIALTRHFPEYADRGLAAIPGQPVLYASAESHLAWLKIAHMTGLGRDAVRLVPVDDSYRMDIDELRRLHAADVAAGMRPFLLVGTSGTTGGGALDPLPELAACAAEWNTHLHVDAAWAGTVAFSDELRPMLAGIEQADSVTVDAHKWMSAPMGAGMFLSKHPQAVAESFRVSTSYMPADTVGSDPYTNSVQWSRRLIGLKVFLGLAVTGQDGYATQVERDTALGRLLAVRAKESGWHRINDTPLPLVCVVDPAVDARLSPAESWAWHSAVADKVVERGQAWISPVRLSGRAALRLCITSYRTEAADVAALVEEMDKARTAVGIPG
ncbi:pyridoxal phosphate-dependent decarboxylase family protein [Streptomyces buecherae]|uniref:pyridoxal phosphate-dependent decarboxylase family protein n=2 Tax=Streptomyces buecherae TaxID=2763006 RepID=UPI001C25BF36|nr:pyridoxal-dependent decarboxylase [Streptomyces buecherae]